MPLKHSHLLKNVRMFLRWYFLPSTFQILAHRSRIRNFKRVIGRVVPKPRLNKHFHNHAVVYEHAVAPAPFAEAKIVFFDEHAHFRREKPGAVGKHFYILYRLRFRPLEHHERVIDRKAVDLVHTEFFKLRILLLVAGAVSGGAGRRECAGEREEDNFFARKNIGGPYLLPAVEVWTLHFFISRLRQGFGGQAHACLQNDLRRFFSLPFFYIFEIVTLP